MTMDQLPPVVVTAGVDDDTLVLKVNGKSFFGWLNTRVTSGIERCPNDFEFTMTERYPNRQSELVQMDFKPGDACKVLLGSDLLLTGYIDAVSPVISAHGHTVSVKGRGKCQDLVDCSAIWPNGQISSSNVLQVARALASPYGIAVNAAPDQDVGEVIPAFNLTYGESAYGVIEFMCRYRGLLAYELPDGSLYLSRATATRKASSGFEEGVNIEHGSSSFSVSQRYSEIGVFSQTTNVYQDLGALSFLVAKSVDKDISRFRNLFVVNEASGPDLSVHQKRADWEKSRRYGRSHRISLTTDSWRDSSGELYAPNTLVDVNSPALKVVRSTWLISEVTFLRGLQGSQCELVLMPPEAFALPPVVIQTWPDVKPLQ